MVKEEAGNFVLHYVKDSGWKTLFHDSNRIMGDFVTLIDLMEAFNELLW